MSRAVSAQGLARDINEFLRFKRAMGISYWRGEIILNGFMRFIAARWGNRGMVALDEAVRRWSSRIAGRKAVTVGLEFGVVRQLCLYRHRRDPTSYVPEHAMAPVKESIFLPYIFTHDKVRRMLSAAARYDGRAISGPMLYALILVLYCTGLRLGEAVRLRMHDVDLMRGTLMIHHSKGRTRIVTFREDLANQLRRYLAAREHQIGAGACNEPQALFLQRDATPLTLRSASDAIRRLLRQLEMKPQSGRIGPRPYEFRHAFAVHRLTAWAVAGVDIHARIAHLSAYLGHQNVLGTEVYLKATPQLMELASGRFEEHLRRARRRK